MAKTVCQKGFQCIQEKRCAIDDKVIHVLQELELEYDSVVKCAKESLDNSQYEMKNCKKNQHFVNEVVEQNIDTCSDRRRRWENEELSMKIADIQMMVKTHQIKNQHYMETKYLMEQRLKNEIECIDALNKQIADSELNVKNVETIQEQLSSVIDDLENSCVVESIYPTEILEMCTKYSSLQTRIEEMENELLKYGDLPPDYSRAKWKLIDAMTYEKELEKRIRSAMK